MNAKLKFTRQITNRRERELLRLIRNLSAMEPNPKRSVTSVCLKRDFEVWRLQSPIFPSPQTYGWLYSRIIWVWPAPRRISAIVREGNRRNRDYARVYYLDTVQNQLASVPVHYPDLDRSGLLNILCHLNGRVGVPYSETCLVPCLPHLSKDEDGCYECRSEAGPTTCCTQPALNSAGAYFAGFPLSPHQKIWQKSHKHHERDESQKARNHDAKPLIRQHRIPLYAVCSPRHDSVRSGKLGEVAA